jgi:hypothetical protein
MRFLLGIVISAALLAAGCSKQPLTLDENTSMKTLLRASDEEITELVIREVAEKLDLPAEEVSVQYSVKYILRDKDSQALAVKISKKQ